MSDGTSPLALEYDRPDHLGADDRGLLRRAGAIGVYLHHVADEAESRGYNFDRSKLPRRKSAPVIEVSDGQLRFEWQHLTAKLRDRDPASYRRFANITDPLPHPFFVVVRGSVASWEKLHG